MAKMKQWRKEGIRADSGRKYRVKHHTGSRPSYPGVPSELIMNLFAHAGIIKVEA